MASTVRNTLFAAAAVALLAAPLAAQDGPGGPQTDFTFNGTGIDNSYVLTNSNAATVGVLLGLTATPRCGVTDCGPAITHAGNTFFAMPGYSDNSPGNPYASWNFDFGILTPAGAVPPDYTYLLSYDFDPAVGNGGLGTYYDPGQDSWNLGMSFLASDLSVGPPFDVYITAPTYEPFDATANGEYYFRLSAFDANMNEVAYADMNVDVGDVSAVPEPGAMTLMATGLVGLAGLSRRKRRR
ncbi:MAG TPA: PEP-CTERM sorting domain-containing protein [Gemmatimonadales bacterium]|jgi:hypothetical protein